jgi:hypothetical protein
MIEPSRSSSPRSTFRDNLSAISVASAPGSPQLGLFRKIIDQMARIADLNIGIVRQDMRDEEGGCKLVMEAANRGDGDASQRASECKAITTKLRGSSEVLVVQWLLYDQCENPDSREVFIEAIGESDRSSATKPPHLWPRGRRLFAP